MPPRRSSIGPARRRPSLLRKFDGSRGSLLDPPSTPTTIDVEKARPIKLPLKKGLCTEGVQSESALKRSTQPPTTTKPTQAPKPLQATLTPHEPQKLSRIPSPAPPISHARSPTTSVHLSTTKLSTHKTTSATVPSDRGIGTPAAQKSSTATKSTPNGKSLLSHLTAIVQTNEGGRPPASLLPATTAAPSPLPSNAIPAAKAPMNTLGRLEMRELTVIRDAAALPQNYHLLAEARACWRQTEQWRQKK
jgi:hypothetical protein